MPKNLLLYDIDKIKSWDGLMLYLYSLPSNKKPLYSSLEKNYLSLLLKWKILWFLCQFVDVLCHSIMGNTCHVMGISGRKNTVVLTCQLIIKIDWSISHSKWIISLKYSKKRILKKTKLIYFVFVRQTENVFLPSKIYCIQKKSNWYNLKVRYILTSYCVPSI